MPYWSSSRVGIVPQGQPQGQATKQKKRNERPNRRKGITMEDLKKQTALRLAQEQQEKQSRAPVAHAFPANQTRSHPGVRGVDAKAGGATLATPHGRAAAIPSPSFSDNELGHSISAFATANAQSRTPDNSGRSSCRFDQRGGLNLNVSSGEDSNTLSQISEVARASELPAPLEHRASTTNLISQVSYESTIDSKPVAKSKLPHGLTVHELKEMTKARLQAEAAEKREASMPHEAHMPVPASVKLASEFRGSRGAPSVSPVPLSFHGNASTASMSPFTDKVDFGRVSYGNSRETWSQDARTDAWESASVSTVASDYFGSESAYSASVNPVSSNLDDIPGTPYLPSRSFSANNAIDGAHKLNAYDGAMTLAIPSTGSFYEPIPNRRRAATLSPRPGLSHLHEDRPFFPSQGIPVTPSFNASTNGLPLTPRSRSGNFIADSYRYPQGVAMSVGRVEGNRARASSAASLPAFSSSTDEFVVENAERSRFPSQFGVLHEGGSPVTGLSNVFREPSVVLSSPPGFNGIGSVSSAGFGSSAASEIRESRLRAATWSEPSSDVFGPGLIGGDDELADDLASILKLSGAEESGNGSFFGSHGL